MDALFWHPFQRAYHLLQHTQGDVLPSDVSKELDSQFEWLLAGPASKFRGPQASSQTAITGGRSVSIQGKKLPVQQKLLDATAKLSALLDLDQFQSHLLLKRWAKETAQEASLDALPAGQQLTLDHAAYMEVIGSYFQERLCMLRIVQLIALQGPQSPALKPFLDRLVRAGLEDRLVSGLRQNIDKQQQAGQSGAGEASAGGAASGQPAPQVANSAVSMDLQLAVQRSVQEHAVLERCELLCSLLALYGGGTGVRCSSHRVLELARLLGTPLAWRGAGFTAADVTAAVEQQAASRGASSQTRLTGLQVTSLLAEHLSATLLLCVLDVPAYLALVQGGDAAPGGLTPDALPLGGKTKDLHADLTAWAGGAPSVMLLITWAALVRLLEPCLDLGEGAEEGLQAAALAAGLFDTAGLLVDLTQHVLSPGSAGLVRRVLLDGVCAVATAFELGPSAQSPADVASLWSLIKRLVAGDAALCEAVWDGGQVALEPLRALLKDAAGLFPAVPTPYLQLLTTFSAGAVAAAEAYQHLRVSVGLVVLHSVREPGLFSQGADRVVLTAPLPWNLAPSVTTMVLPAGIQGSILPMPSVLSDRSVREWALVSWDVDGTHPSFGQLLLLGRTAHLLHCLANAVYASTVPDAAQLQELSLILDTLCALVGQSSGSVEDLLSVRVDAQDLSGTLASTPASQKPTYGWLRASCDALQLLARLASTGTSVAPIAGSSDGSAGREPVLSAMRSALSLLSVMAGHHPTTVLRALHLVAGGHPETVFALPDSLPLPTAVTGPLLIAGPVLAEPPRLLQLSLEVASRDYTATQALLQLLSSLLDRGFVTGPVPSLVLSCLLHLLPTHQQWTYRTPADRWALTADILQVLCSAITAGTTVVSPGPWAGQACVVPEGVSVTGLSAAVLQHLLSHGGDLLFSRPPAAAQDLEMLGVVAPQGESNGGLLSAAELGTARLLQLLPLVLAAAPCIPGGTQLEERVLLGTDATGPPPAALLLSFLAYEESGGGLVPGETPLAHRALLLMRTLAACVAGRRAGAPLTMASFLPPDSDAHAALQAMLSRAATSRDPEGQVLLLSVLESCAAQHGPLLDSLLPVPPPAPAVASTEGGDGRTRKAAASTPAAPVHSADALLELLAWATGTAQVAGEDDGAAGLQPLYSPARHQVLCGVVRLLASGLQTWSLGPHWVPHVLGSDRFWSALETTVSQHTGGGRPGSSPAAQLAAAYGWQVLAMLAARQPRSTAGTSGPHNHAWRLLDKLAHKRLLQQALSWHVEACEQLAGQAAALQRQLLALQLELGAAAVVRSDTVLHSLGGVFGTQASPGVGGLLAPPGLPGDASQSSGPSEDIVPQAAAIRQELSPVLALLSRGAAQYADVSEVHAYLLAGGAEPGSPDSTGSPSDVAPARPTSSGYQVLAALTHPPGGAALLTAITSQGMATLVGGGGAQPVAAWGTGTLAGMLDDGTALLRSLGPVLSQELAAAEGVVTCLGMLRAASNSATAQWLALQAAATLAGALVHDAQSASELLGAGSGGGPQAQPLLSLLAGYVLPAGTLLVAAWDASPSAGAGLVCGSAWGAGCLAGALAASTHISGLLLHTLSLASSTAQPAAGRTTPQGSKGAASTQLCIATTPGGVGGKLSAGARADVQTCCGVVEGMLAWLSAVTPLTGGQHQGAARRVADTLARAASLCLQQQPPSIPGGSGGSVGSAGAAVSTSGSGALGGSFTPGPTPGGAAGGGGGDPLLLQTRLLASLLPVWSACSAGRLSMGPALQVLVQTVMRHLAPQEWLPLLQAHLDLQGLLAVAAAQLAADDDAAGGGPSASEDTELAGALQAEPRGLGVLHLALLAAQVPQGATWLHTCGVLPALSQLAAQLLAAQGAALAEFPTLSLSLQPVGLPGAPPPPPPLISRPASQAAQAAALAGLQNNGLDTAGTYLVDRSGPAARPRAVWSPLHTQWCTLLSFSGALLRSVGQTLDVSSDATDLLRVAEARLLLAVLPPAATATQPLTLADTAERERALFLLTQLAQYRGSWHMVRPASIVQFRAAAVSFLSFAAGVSSTRPVTLQCPPLSSQEQRWAAQPTGLPRTEGWFRAAALGSADSTGLGGPGSTSGAGSVQGSASQGAAPTAGAGVGGSTSAAAGGTAGQPLTPLALPGASTPPAGGAGGGAAATTCSEFAARLAEGIYTCLLYALVFLQSTSPEVSDGERAAGLGPGWPRTRELVALQDQCVAVLFSLADTPPSQPGTGRGHTPQEARRLRCCRLLARVLQSLCDMLDLVGCSASRAALVGRLREQLPLIERALAQGQPVPLPASPVLASLLPTSPSLLRTMSESVTTSVA